MAPVSTGDKLELLHQIITQFIDKYARKQAMDQKHATKGNKVLADTLAPNSSSPCGIC